MSAPRKPVPPAAKPKGAGVVQTRRVPSPPPAYRPRPEPGVSQAKALASRQAVGQPRQAHPAPYALRNQAAPNAARTKDTAAPAVQPKMVRQPAARPNSPPQPARGVLQPKPVANKPAAAARNIPANNTAAARPVIQRSARPAVVQAIKFYPNLHPGAVERVEPGNLFRLENFTDQYRLRKTGSHGVYVPNQQYNFVRTVEGQTLLHSRYRHPSIAEGRHVLYAGEVFFNNGRLQWWSNGSGHYQPDAEDAAQAGLPIDYFYTYQQVIKGEHKQRR